MSDYVLVSQGIECDRNSNPYPIIKYAIDGNREYNKYLERCAEENERPADNELFVHKEDRDKVEEIDLFMCEYLIKQAREDVIKEISRAMYHEAFEVDHENDGMQKWDSGNWIRYKLFENVLEQLKENKNG